MGSTIIVSEDWAGLRWAIAQPSSQLLNHGIEKDGRVVSREFEWKETKWITYQGPKQQFIDLREDWLHLLRNYSKESNRKARLVNMSLEIQQLLKSEDCQIQSHQSRLPKIQDLLAARHIFAYVETTNKYDLKKASDISKKIYMETCPQSYLEVTVTDDLLIYHVTPNSRKLLFRSPYNEKFNYQIIKKVLARHQVNGKQHFGRDLDEIYAKGNSNKADLLVQDLCGLDNCASLGLPGKLIASSLAKYVQNEENTQMNWDQLQSLVQAFAINIGIQIGLQIHLTKVKTILYRIGHFDHPNFLHTIQSLVSDQGSIWFCQNMPLLEIS